LQKPKLQNTRQKGRLTPCKYLLYSCKVKSKVRRFTDIHARFFARVQKVADGGMMVLTSCKRLQFVVSFPYGIALPPVAV